MKKFNYVIFIISLFILYGCSSTPELVTRLNKIQIPVVQPDSENITIESVDINRVYTKNRLKIHALTALLKKRYLKDIKPRDVFDTHNLPHHVYTALSNLEEAEMVNEQYYHDNNMKGLVRIQEMLEPFTV